MFWRPQFLPCIDNAYEAFLQRRYHHGRLAPWATRGSTRSRDGTCLHRAWPAEHAFGSCGISSFLVPLTRTPCQVSLSMACARSYCPQWQRPDRNSVPYREDDQGRLRAHTRMAERRKGLMAERTVASPHVQQPATTERTRQHERFMTPAVDIYDALIGFQGLM
jgi:hypothetical protein